MLPELLSLSTWSGTKEEIRVLGAALGATLCAFDTETTLCGFDAGATLFGGFAVDATLCGFAVDTVLFAFSIINSSGLVRER
jgi:hypothetical protein